MSGKLEGGPRSIFPLDLLPSPRLPSHEPLIALFALILFSSSSSFFDPQAGENRLSWNAKEETSNEEEEEEEEELSPFETMLFYRHKDR